MTDSSTLDAPVLESASHNTHAMDVGVSTRYIEGQSAPDEQRYVFAYTITLTNQSKSPTQLIGRHWVITDANDEVQEVKGVGVVGQQPVLKPGESYTYTSGVVIATDTGTMTGSYQMRPLWPPTPLAIFKAVSSRLCGC